MTAAKHTPGPWAIRDHWADDGAFEVYPTRGGKKPKFGEWAALAEVREYGPDEAPEAEANARLIAAAPDLLEALKESRMKLQWFAESYPHDIAAPNFFASIDAAIAKATGEQK